MVLYQCPLCLLWRFVIVYSIRHGDRSMLALTVVTAWGRLRPTLTLDRHYRDSPIHSRYTVPNVGSWLLHGRTWPTQNSRLTCVGGIFVVSECKEKNKNSWRHRYMARQHRVYFWNIIVSSNALESSLYVVQPNTTCDWAGMWGDISITVHLVLRSDNTRHCLMFNNLYDDAMRVYLCASRVAVVTPIHLHLHQSRSLVERWGATDDLQPAPSIPFACQPSSWRRPASCQSIPGRPPISSSASLFFSLHALCPAGLFWQAV